MNAIRQHWSIAVCFLLAAGFSIWPGTDLAVSTLFYRDGEGFFLRNNALVQSVHHAIPWVATIATVGLIGWSCLGFLPAFSYFERTRRPACYLLMVLALGPGLLANGLFKSHSGRARPSDVVEFGGDKVFTPPMVFADQCPRNCSFVSGHASFGFAVCALGFLTRRRFWFGVGLASGALLGLARVVHGKHFLSDVVFAFFVVYFCAKLLHFLLYRSRSPLPGWNARGAIKSCSPAAEI